MKQFWNLKWDPRFSGDPTERATPVPIPNTEVKPLRADGTARATVWETRSLPGIKTPRSRKARRGFCFSAIVSCHFPPILRYSLTHDFTKNDANSALRDFSSGDTNGTNCSVGQNVTLDSSEHFARSRVSQIPDEMGEGRHQIAPTKGCAAR